MAETDAPGGKLGKKQWYAIAAVGAGYVGYRWWKAKQSPATAATTTGSALGTPIGVDANGNPVYMNSSGQEVDASGNPDSVVTASSAVGTSGTGYDNPAPIASDGLPPAGSAPQTDEQWTEAVTQDLEEIGYDATTVATAIAQYLASQPLTPAQVTIIRTAWSYEGRPPGEPNLPIIQQSSGTTTTTTTGGGGTGGTGGGASLAAVPLKDGEVINVPVLLTTGKTWATVAKQAGESVSHLQQANPGVNGNVGDVIQVPVLVQNGATWQSIADTWAVSATHLEQNNPSIAHPPNMASSQS